MLGRMERTLPNRQFALRSAAFFAVVSLAMAAFGAWLTYRFTFGAGEADPLRFVGLTTGILTLLATLPGGSEPPSPRPIVFAFDLAIMIER